MAGRTKTNPAKQAIFLGPGEGRDYRVDAPKGAFVLAPGGMKHDFENRSGSRAGVLNLSFPGGFEANMHGIAEWFAKHPPGNA